MSWSLTILVIPRLTPGSIRLRWSSRRFDRSFRKVSGVDTNIIGVQQMQKFHMRNSFTHQQTWKIQALDSTHNQVYLIACLNHVITSLVINASRSVHSPCDRCVESIIQSAVQSGHRQGELGLDLPQPAEDRGDTALHLERA